MATISQIFSKMNEISSDDGSEISEGFNDEKREYELVKNFDWNNFEVQAADVESNDDEEEIAEFTTNTLELSGEASPHRSPQPGTSKQQITFDDAQVPVPTWEKQNKNWKEGLNDFVGTTCIPEHLADLTEPFEIFCEFFTDELIDSIVFQTNLYSEQLHLQDGKRLKHKPCKADELRSFIGINLLMGIKVLPSYKDYWSSAPDLKDSYISKLMTRDRFSWFLSHLHLNDNTFMKKRGEKDYDKLYKIRPFITSIANTFELNFLPSQILAVDESMIKFKGKSYLKQNMPKKPTKRGYKVWVLADKTGYNYKFEIYTGKNEVVEKNLGQPVVRNLTENLCYKYHHVYFDNYFTGHDLMVKLKKRGIYACGTVNPNRKHLPTLTVDKNLQRGEYDWSVSSTDVAMVKWKDNQSVHLLSNFHDPEKVVEVNRREKDGSKTKVPCPVVLKDYNSHMNCVDKFDQYKGTYEVDRKSKKWWHRIFFYFLDACVVNSYIIYKELKLPIKNTKDFRRDICTGLVTKALVHSTRLKRKASKSPIRIKNKKPFVPKEIREEGSTHLPVKLGTRRRCAYCSTKQKEVRTGWMCKTCNVPLCLSKERTCFQDHHAASK